MKDNKELSFREIRQAEKAASRREDALALEQGVSPAELQKKNSAFKKNIFKNAPIMRAGEIISL